MWRSNARLSITEAFLNGLHENISSPFSPPATHGAVTVLWKQIEIYASQGRFEISKHLCALAQHRLFQNCGEGNKGKITRKLIQCSIANKNWDSARQYFFAMPEAVQAMPQSQFLLYKVAIRSDDEQLGRNLVLLLPVMIKQFLTIL